MAGCFRHLLPPAPLPLEAQLGFRSDSIPKKIQLNAGGQAPDLQLIRVIVLVPERGFGIWGNARFVPEPARWRPAVVLRS